MSTIKGSEFPLHKVLSADFEFHIPDYQRPYAWTTEQASELFDDLWGFMEAEGETEKYFLGSIVLVKADDVSKADVVDGQQRLTTLTILLAAIGHKLAPDPGWKGAFDNFVREPGQKALKLEPKPRLFLRERDRKFFSQYVQTPDSFPLILTQDTAKLSEAQCNIVGNACHFVERLQGKSADEVGRFGQFVVNNCYLVVVSTDSFHSAYRIFSILNDRGLELEPSDILKAKVIGSIHESKRAAYTDIWEDLEEQCGRRAFNDVINHIRMIFRKEKARRSQIEEFEEHVLKKAASFEALIDDVIAPYAQAFQVAINASYESKQDAEEVNRLLGWLGRLNNADWVPVAMYLIRRDEGDTEGLIRHLSMLERLAASMFIRGAYNTPRIERYGKVLAALEQGQEPDAPDSPMNLSHEEIGSTLYYLDGLIYTYSAKLRSYIMLRLDSFLAGAGALYQHSVTTIEHVLPQTVSPGSEWERLWTPADRASWTNRIGNLVLLSKGKNSEAQNFDFEEKKEKYGSSVFAVVTPRCCGVPTRVL